MAREEPGLRFCNCRISLRINNYRRQRLLRGRSLAVYTVRRFPQLMGRPTRRLSEAMSWCKRISEIQITYLREQKRPNRHRWNIRKIAASNQPAYVKRRSRYNSASPTLEVLRMPSKIIKQPRHRGIKNPGSAYSKSISLTVGFTSLKRIDFVIVGNFISYFLNTVKNHSACRKKGSIAAPLTKHFFHITAFSMVSCK